MNIKSLMVASCIGFVSWQVHAKGSGIDAAAANGDIQALTKYLDANPQALSSRNTPGRSLLCVAAMNGQTEAVKFLISRGADVNDGGFEGMTPLADMAAYGTTNDEKCAEVASVLLAHGAQVDPVDAYHKTPLLHSVESEKSRLARVLLEHGASLTPTYTGVISGATVLHMAVLDRDMAMVKVLLEFKAPLNVRDRDGATPLLLAEEQNQTEIADLLRQADPEAAKGSPTYSIPPTKEAMRALAVRIAGGDDAAFDELARTAESLYGEMKDYQKEQARVMVLLFRMKAAFDVLGAEAGKGNPKALSALKKSLKEPRLAAFAPDALGIAAASGNQEALNILLQYNQWGILESSAQFALCVPASTNIGPAVDYLVALISDPANSGSGVVNAATNALASAAALGSQKAKSALEQFDAAQPTAMAK